MKTQLLKGEKEYRFTTFDHSGDEVETYTIQAFNIKEARKTAQNVVGNSRDNEDRHGRVTLTK